MKLRNDKEINALFASAHQSEILPQKPQKPQKLLAQEEPPTDVTDVHRLGGPTKLFSHRSHRTHRNDWRRRASHRCHRCTQIRRAH